MRFSAAWALIAVGCVGKIGAPPGVSGGGGSGTGAGAGNDPAACMAAAPSTTRVRRLTKVEIQTSTSTLLNQDTTSLLSNLDSDSVGASGFSNSDQLVVSGSFANSLNLAAETIGTAFKSTVTKTAYGATCFASDSAAEACAKTFIQSFGVKAFRRAITPDDVTALTTVYEAGRAVGTDGDAGDRFSTGLSWVVRAMVQSPDFLYLTELGDPAAANGGKTTMLPDEVASAISYSLLGMPPDDALVAAAAQNQLATGDQRSAQAMRLIAAYPDNWKRQMGQFVPQWLGINFSKPEWTKNTDQVPLYTPELRDALQTETTMLLDDWATSPDGARLDKLLTTTTTFINSVNAPVYGLTATGSTFQPVSLDPTQRAGILTFAGFLGSMAHVAETSPVMRGKAIMQKFLCLNPPPPPPNIPPLPPIGQSSVTTTRARFAAHESQAACSSCHSTFEPMGDAFEEYDAIGSYRTQQNGYPIDSSGALVGATGGDKPVANAIELVNLLAQSPDTYACVAKQAFRFTVGRDPTLYEACDLVAAQQTWSENQLDVRALVSSIVSADSFVVRTVNQ